MTEMIPTASSVPIPVAKAGKDRQRAYSKSAKGKAKRKVTNKEYAARRAEWEYLNKEFVAWDGEGVTREEGEKQDYVLFANSRGESLSAGEAQYLSTARLFDFILRRVRKNTINVIYGASYDWNMWLRDVPRETLETLYETGEATYGAYWIKWRPGKTFHIGKRGTKDTALFYDVVSFFQRAFIAACDEYLGDKFAHRDLIVKNKRLRGSFTEEDLAEIAMYCDAELENLVSLMNELRERLYRAGLKVSRWDGPGAIAVALFQQHGIKEHLRRTEYAESDAVRAAYFGGRFEVIKTGYVENAVYEYDVNSAYPWALQDVPSMARGHWETHPHYVDPGTDFALYHVTFAGTEEHFDKPYPLPFRREDGNVCFPQYVTGWYWGPEIATALKYVELYGGTIDVLETRVFVPASDVKPFAFIGPLYQKRRALKAAGDGAHVGIKLGLNSMYGKLAQQVGWSETPDGLRLPPYHQLEWAGYVTSRCRAAVFGAVLPDLSQVIAFETDAMFTTEKLEVEEGAQLGQWEYTEFSDMLYLQSGTYFAHEGGKAVDKTRGVDRGELTFDDAYSALKDGRSTVPAKLTRFNALGIALAQRFEKWLVWETMTKEVKVNPSGKRMHLHEMCTQCGNGLSTLGNFHETWADWSVKPGDESTVFPIEWENQTDLAKTLAGYRRDNIERKSEDD